MKPILPLLAIWLLGDVTFVCGLNSKPNKPCSKKTTPQRAPLPSFPDFPEMPGFLSMPNFPDFPPLPDFPPWPDSPSPPSAPNHGLPSNEGQEMESVEENQPKPSHPRKNKPQKSPSRGNPPKSQSPCGNSPGKSGRKRGCPSPPSPVAAQAESSGKPNDLPEWPPLPDFPPWPDSPSPPSALEYSPPSNEGQEMESLEENQPKPSHPRKNKPQKSPSWRNPPKSQPPCRNSPGNGGRKSGCHSPPSPVAAQAEGSGMYVDIKTGITYRYPCQNCQRCVNGMVLPILNTIKQRAIELGALMLG